VFAKNWTSIAEYFSNTRVNKQHSTDIVPWEGAEEKTWQVGDDTINGLPYGTKVMISHKAVGDLSLWYYVDGYIDPTTGEEVYIPDEETGNWVFQRNRIELESEDIPDTAYCGLRLQAKDGTMTELGHAKKIITRSRWFDSPSLREGVRGDGVKKILAQP
jgi:hypothetical protein